MTASFVWSKATGLAASSLAGPRTSGGRVTGPARRGASAQPERFINTDGASSTTAHHGQGQLVYELPAGFLVGANYTHSRAALGTAHPAARGAVGWPTQILGEPSTAADASPPGTFSTCGCRRSSTREAGRFRLFADGLNVTTTARTTTMGGRLGTSDAFGLRTAFVAAPPADAGAKLTF
jgi:hypothetical protein